VRPAISGLLESAEVIVGMAGVPLPLPIAGGCRLILGGKQSKVSIRFHDEIAAATVVRPPGASTVDDLLPSTCSRHDRKLLVPSVGTFDELLADAVGALPKHALKAGMASAPLQADNELFAA
jgi:hypothetical protein